MEAKDLRIGNWVNYQRNEILKEPTQITWLSDNQVGVNEHSPDGASWPKSFDIISGIELTPDILGKAAKSVEGFHDGVILYKFGIFTFWTQGKSIWCELDGLHNLRPEIIYVHQLQNLYYALTQTELDIKL